MTKNSKTNEKSWPEMITNELTEQEMKTNKITGRVGH